MCTGWWAKCMGDLLFPMALCSIVANILLYFPNGEVWGTYEITKSVWYFPGVIGGGVLVLLPALVIRAAGMEGNCFANRCGMMFSMIVSIVGLAGALYCMIVSIVGLKDGPVCDTGNGVFIYPFSNLTLNESYLFSQEIWQVCERPENVVLWNIILFSILLGMAILEAILSLTQVVNGLLGCICGTCMNKRQANVA